MSSVPDPAKVPPVPRRRDRWLRRGFHVAGAIILLLYALPRTLFGVLPREDLLFLGLAVVAGIESLRWAGKISLPAMRPFESRRPASFVYFGIGITLVILFFPEPIAIVAVGGAALIDPLIGELRGVSRSAGIQLGVPGLAYGGFAAVALALSARTPLPWALAIGAGAALVALCAERPRIWWMDDDLLLTLGPAIFLALVGVVVPVARIT